MRANLNIDFIGKRKIYYTISICLIALGVIISIVLGPKLSIQFKGGTIIEYAFSGEINSSDAKDVAQGVLKDASLTAKIDVNSATKSKSIVYEINKSLTTEAQQNLYKALTDKFSGNNVQKGTSQTVSAAMGAAFIQKSVLAVVLASLLIVLYIWIRFRKIGGLPAGVFAFVALMHDVAMGYVAFALMRIPLDENFIAVTLTILGYSINDTIVVFDRVRENRRLYGSKMSFKDTVNKSINQSFARSINTTAVTFTAIAILGIFSVIYHLDSVTSFALPMMVGVATGCYSTICIAGPLWVSWETHKENNAAAEKARIAAEKEARHKKLEQSKSKKKSK